MSGWLVYGYNQNTHTETRVVVPNQIVAEDMYAQLLPPKGIIPEPEAQDIRGD